MTDNSQLVIEDNIGVCGVQNDTRTMASAILALRDTPGRLLELGTGSGFVAIEVARNGWDVEAVDVSPRAIELARRNASLNQVEIKIYPSDLYSEVKSSFDVIAFNPPMRPSENEFTRIITSILRRYMWLGLPLLKLSGNRLESDRIEFLSRVLLGARQVLNPDGHLLLGISPPETEKLAELKGVCLVDVTAIPEIPLQQISDFQLEKTA
ncbi:MAG: methyltransferase [Chloroflexota bacterium]|nr:methyltransferase [Chloroflexota bacterium]